MGDGYFKRNKTNSINDDVKINYHNKQWHKKIFDDETQEIVLPVKSFDLDFSGCRSIDDFISQLNNIKVSCNPDKPNCVERLIKLLIKGDDLSKNQEFKHCKCYDILKEHYKDLLYYKSVDYFVKDCVKYLINNWCLAEAEV